jgi:hypothetical protein
MMNIPRNLKQGGFGMGGNPGRGGNLGRGGPVGFGTGDQ